MSGQLRERHALVRVRAAARRPLSRERGGQPSSSMRLTWMSVVEGEGRYREALDESRRNTSHLNSSTVVTALLRPALTTALSSQLEAGHRPCIFHLGCSWGGIFGIAHWLTQ